MARPFRPTERQAVLASLDVLASASAVTLALFAWTFSSGDTFSAAFLGSRAWWFLAVPVWLLALSPSRQAHAALDLRATVRSLVRATVILFGIYLVAFFYFGSQHLPRLMAVYVLWNGVWLTLAARVVVIFVLTRGRFTRRLLVLGDAQAFETVEMLVRSPALADTEIVRGEAGEDGDAGSALEQGVTEIVVALPAPLDPHLAQRLLRCQAAGVGVITLEQLYESTLLRVPVRHLSEGWLLVEMFGGQGLQDSSPLVKRALDIVAALSIGVITLPLWAVAAVAVWLTDRGPVWYRQTRLGRDGRPFTLTKFRTMRMDAEADGPRWSEPDDTRLTPVGRWLRRTHIDELPNLWQVLRGEMSLVGPRPERPEFVESLEQEIPWYRARLIVQPGLTGWAQVNQGYGDSVAASLVKLEYDLYYIRHRSVWFDLAILLRTVWRMAGFKGR